MRKNSVKNIRINEEVKKVLSTIIMLEIKDPRISPMTGVTEVDVATDLKTCKVYISVLGDEQEAQATIEGLNRAKGFIRSLLAKEINLRNTPELTFILDRSALYGMEMEEKISAVIRQDEENARKRGE